MGKSGAGEREGRVYSDMVLRRHFNLSHGIGESLILSKVSNFEFLTSFDLRFDVIRLEARKTRKIDLFLDYSRDFEVI